jgi:hypothetical protein
VKQISRRIEQQTTNETVLDRPGTNPLTDAVLETLLQTSSQALATQFLKGWQRAFANLLELGMLLTELMGPIAAAGSVIPLQGRPL